MHTIHNQNSLGGSHCNMNFDCTPLARCYVEIKQKSNNMLTKVLSDATHLTQVLAFEIASPSATFKNISSTFVILNIFFQGQ